MFCDCSLNNRVRLVSVCDNLTIKSGVEALVVPGLSGLRVKNVPHGTFYGIKTMGEHGSIELTDAAHMGRSLWINVLFVAI